MTALQKLFATKNKNILNIYTTAGFPKLNDTMPIMEALQSSGVDIIELGMPYSDPLADGETIQLSSKQALENGMSLQVLLEQLKDCRKTINIPIVLMGYLNPLLQFGFENFCAKISAIGIDALIIPDIPMVEFELQYHTILKKYNIDFIFLVTPQTPVDRIKKLDALSSGFLYAVTSSSTTGSTQNFEVVQKYLTQLESLQLQNPILAGFGISDKITFNTVAAHCNGGIIGSAFIKKISIATNVVDSTKEFVNNILH